MKKMNLKNFEKSFLQRYRVLNATNNHRGVKYDILNYKLKELKE